MLLSTDDKTAYLYTFSNQLIMVNIQDLDNPRIESVLEVSRIFIVIHDFSWAIELTKSRYRLFDISKLYLQEEDTIPNLVKQHLPISYTDIQFSHGSKVHHHHSHFRLFQEHNLIIYVITPIRRRPTI